MRSPEQPLEPHAPVGKPKGAYCRAWPVIASSVTQAIVPLPDGHFVVAVEVRRQAPAGLAWLLAAPVRATCITSAARSEEHTSELQSLMRNSYAVFCLKEKNILQLQQNAKQISHKNSQQERELKLQ